jgi:hypothetical protein
MDELETFAWAEKPFVPKQPETNEINQIEEDSCEIGCLECGS